MTKQEIVARVNNVIKDLNSQDDPNAELEFYKEFISNSDGSYIGFLQSVSNTDAFLALLNIKMKNTPFEALSSDVKAFSKIIEKMSKDDITKLFEFFYYLYDDHEMDLNCVLNLPRVLDVYSDFKRGVRPEYLPSDFEALGYFIKKYDLSPITESLGKAMHNCFSNDMYNHIVSLDSGYDLSVLTRYYDNYQTMVIDAFLFIARVRVFCKRLDELENRIVSNTAKEKKKIIKDIIAREYNMETLRSYRNEIEDYYRNLEKEDKKRKANRNKAMADYSKFLEFFEKIDFSRPIDEKTFERLKGLLRDKEVLECFYQFVFDYNEAFINRMEEKYRVVVDDTSYKIGELLNLYDIPKDEVDISLIIGRNGYDTVRKMLSLLTKFLTLQELIIMALEYSDLEHVQRLYELFELGVLNEKVLDKYRSLLYKGSKEYRMLESNLGIIANCKYNVANFAGNPEVLIECDCLQDNFKVLNDYRLFLVGKNREDIDYHFLMNHNLVGLIDQLLELGLETELLNDFNLLNVPNIERLWLLKRYGMMPTNKKDLLETLYNSNFIVPDSMVRESFPNLVEEVVTNSVVTGIDSIEVLRRLKPNADSRTCAIGVGSNALYFSLNKVCRNYADEGEEKKSIFYALLRDRPDLTMEEIEGLKLACAVMDESEKKRS